MMFPKSQCIKLQGKEKEALRKAIFDRDKHRCVVCGGLATDWHHEKKVAGLRSDTIEEGCCLCRSCHVKRHSNDYNHKIRDAIRRYLNELYHIFEK